MQEKDTRIWYNSKTGEIVSCKYHYDCDVINEKIKNMGKINFFRDGWCRLGVYEQNDKKIGIAEAYDKKNLKKAVEYLLSMTKINTIITETHNTYDCNMEIFKNPFLKENIDGI